MRATGSGQRLRLQPPNHDSVHEMFIYIPKSPLGLFYRRSGMSARLAPSSTVRRTSDIYTAAMTRFEPASGPARHRISGAQRTSGADSQTFAKCDCPRSSPFPMGRATIPHRLFLDTKTIAPI
ncbi:hypothetical protein VTO73DRAFT_10219 [Trametes versicolor]